MTGLASDACTHVTQQWNVSCHTCNWVLVCLSSPELGHQPSGWEHRQLKAALCVLERSGL